VRWDSTEDKTPTAKRRQIVIALALTLVPYLAVALALSLRTPAWENNDEQDHVRYSEYLLSHHSLPPVSVANGIESHQPPLYYVTLAVWQKAFGIHAFIPSLSSPPGHTAILDRVNEGSHDYTPQQLTNANSLHVMRLLSVVFGGLTVAAAFMFALLLSGQLHMAVASGATVSVWPKFDVVSAAVSNEAFTDAFVASAMVFLLLSFQRSQRVLWSAAAGGALGAAVLAKFTALPTAGLVLLVVAVVGINRRDWRPSVAALIPFLAMSGWWFVHNTLTYGDPLADAASRAYLARAVPGLIWAHPTLNLQVLTFGGTTLVKSVWYDGGWNQLLLPLWLDIIVTAVAVACLLRGACLLWRREWPSSRSVIMIMLLVPTIGSVIAWLLILRETTQAEGRYLLVAVSAWGFLLCLGTDGLFRSRRALRYLTLAIWPAMFLAIDLFVFLHWEIPYGGT
jgi:hypothetical protein